MSTAVAIIRRRVLQSGARHSGNVLARGLRALHSVPARTSRRSIVRGGSLWRPISGGLARSYIPLAVVPSRGVHSVKAHMGVRFVPQQEAWVVERMGKFDRVLSPGIAFLIPVLDTIAYAHSLKMVTLEISRQKGITKDNVNLTVDGVLYYQVKDPIKASYEIEDPQQAIEQLAMSTMRSQLGQMTLEQTFEERETLNRNIVEVLNEAAQKWGIWVERYEIRDIIPPEGIQEAMELQAVAERRKRQAIIESEGSQQSEINVATGKARSVIISSEAKMTEQINVNKGEAEAIRIKADAVGAAIERLAGAIASPGGKEAVGLRVAEQYVAAFGNIAQTGNTILLPANLESPAAMIGQAMGLYEGIRKGTNTPRGGGGAGGGPSGDSSAVQRSRFTSQPTSMSAGSDHSSAVTSGASGTSGGGPPPASASSSGSLTAAAGLAGAAGLSAASVHAAMSELESERHAASELTRQFQQRMDQDDAYPSSSYEGERREDSSPRHEAAEHYEEGERVGETPSLKHLLQEAWRAQEENVKKRTGA